MPEGPEVHTEALRIERNIGAGQKVRLHLDYEKLTRDGNAHRNEDFLGVQAYGKALVLSFGSGECIYSHNQLYGKWLFSDDKSTWIFRNRQRRLRIESEHGWAELYSASEVFWLPRDEIALHPYIQKLGPDIVNTELPTEAIADHLFSKRFLGKKLNTLLLDQAFLSGVGNYLRSEILFSAGINPQLRVKDLSETQKQDLISWSLRLGRRSLESKGRTLDTELFHWIKKNKAHTSRNDLRFWTFARVGKPCWVCGTTIRKEYMANRRLYWCPQCQA